MPQAQKAISVPTHAMDIMPTILALANIETTQNQAKKLNMQGVSLLSTLHGEKNKALFGRGFGGELFGMRYYRKANWKALLMPEPYGSGDWQLYDISLDPGEQNDLSASHPKLAAQLTSAWEDYSKINGVVEPDKPIAYAKPPTLH